MNKPFIILYLNLSTKIELTPYPPRREEIFTHSRTLLT
jgi:hypothetical protein